MDLISSVNYIDHRLGGRKPNQGKGKPAPRRPDNEREVDKAAQTDVDHAATTEYDSHLGRKLDITA